MNKGMVMNISRKTATIFTSDCRMVKVPVKPDMVRGREYDLDQAEPVTIRLVSRRWVPAMVAACLVALLVGGILFSGLLPQPVYATLSIDVNPSIEFSLNRDLAVIRSRAINEEARQLLAGHDFTGLSWQEAVRQWTQILKAQNVIQVQNMLISAVLPDDALELKNQLVAMEGLVNQGELSQIEVRVIYSSDSDVAGQAVQNGLSVGRQMLLNQAESQGEILDNTTIAQARLGDLVGRLLQKGDHDQTRLTIRETQSLSEATGATETQRETNGSQAGTQPTERETNRETNRETDGSPGGTQATSRETSGSQSGTMATSRETNRETSQASQTSTASTGTPATSGSQQGGPGGKG